MPHMAYRYMPKQNGFGILKIWYFGQIHRFMRRGELAAPACW